MAGFQVILEIFVLSEFTMTWPFFAAETKAESYNETFRGTESVDVIKRFLYFNKEVGMHFKKTSSEDDLAEEDFEDVSKEDSPKESTVTGMW